MPITRRQVMTGATGLSSGTTLAFPFSPLADSLLLAVTRCPAFRTPAVPAGWTLLRASSDSTSRTTIHYKVADGTETGYHLQMGTTGEYIEAIVIEYAGVDPTAPIDTHAGAVGTGTPTVIAAPSLTTALPGGLLVTTFGFTHTGGGANRFSAPTGMSEAAEVSAFSTPNPNPALAVDDQTVIGVTTTGPRVATLSVTPGYSGVTGQSVLLKVKNTAPNAPTLSTPADGSTVNLETIQRFTVPFSDDDPGDTQSALDVRYSGDSGATWTTLSRTGPNNYIDLPADTLTAGDYEVQGRSYDALGVASGWGPSTFFTAATPPDGPTITDPASGAALGSSTYPVAFSYPTLTQYEWRVLGDLAGEADLTNVIDAGGTVTDASSRSFTITGLPNGVSVHIQLRVYDGGLWSAWADSLNPVSYFPPAVPVVDLTVDDTEGHLVVTYTNPAPDVDEVTTVSVDIYLSTDGGVTSERHATGLPPDSTWIYEVPASGVDYAVNVVGVGSNGVETGSDWVTEDLGTYGYGGYGSGPYGGAA